MEYAIYLVDLLIRVIVDMTVRAIGKSFYCEFLHNRSSVFQYILPMSRISQQGGLSRQPINNYTNQRLHVSTNQQPLLHRKICLPDLETFTVQFHRILSIFQRYPPTSVHDVQALTGVIEIDGFLRAINHLPAIVNKSA